MQGLRGGGVVVVVVGSTQLCGHTNFVFGLKLGCDNTSRKTAMSMTKDVLLIKTQHRKSDLWENEGKPDGVY